jgi:catechol 2,3-dioxygenase-like lactoylglutathione lyase family enzyme
VHRGLIDHLDLTVSDLSTSETFYASVLGYMGFEFVRLADDRTKIPIFQKTGQNGRLFSIALQPARRGGKEKLHDRYAPGLHHIALQASDRADVDALHRHLQEIGATVLDAPAEYPQYAPDYYAVFFTDPDGLKLEYVHMPVSPEFVAQGSGGTSAR